MFLSLLQSNFESFAGCDHVGVEFPGVVDDFLQIGIFVVRIMVVERDAFGAGLESRANRLFPAAMAPADMVRQFFRSVLRSNDKEVRMFRQPEDVPVAPVEAMLDIRAI